MPWWGWMLCGSLLLGAELVAVEADFYLVFFGFAAVVVGVADLAGMGGPNWAEWLAYAVVALVSTVLFRQRVYEKLRPPGGPVSDSVVGETASVRESIAAGGHGHAELRGAVWQAKNVGAAPLGAGERARVAGVEGLTLLLRSDT